MRFEFPRGSGLAADYDDAEADEIRSLIRASEEGRIERAELELVCRLIHEAKVHAGARLVPDSERRPEPEPLFYVPPPDSPFQIPAGAIAELMYDGPAEPDAPA